MRSNFDYIFKKLIGHEGGWGNDPRDRGNWTSGKIGVGVNKGTKYGIAAHVYPNLDIKNITLADAKEIYLRDYWAPVNGDKLPSGVDYSVFDIAVNSGVGRAKQFLKRCTKTDPIGIIEELYTIRQNFYQGLSTFSVYGKGWTRRNKEVRTEALKLANQATPPSPAGDPQPASTEKPSSPPSSPPPDTRHQEHTPIQGSGIRKFFAGLATAAAAAGAWVADHWYVPVGVLVIALVLFVLYNRHNKS